MHSTARRRRVCSLPSTEDQNVVRGRQRASRAVPACIFSTGDSNLYPGCSTLSISPWGLCTRGSATRECVPQRLRSVGACVVVGLVSTRLESEGVADAFEDDPPQALRLCAYIPILFQIAACVKACTVLRLKGSTNRPCEPRCGQSRSSGTLPFRNNAELARCQPRVVDPLPLQSQQARINGANVGRLTGRLTSMIPGSLCLKPPVD